MALTFIDLFSGIGGFRLGLEQAGHKCLGHCEIDKYANISYAAIHQPEGEWFNNDITKVRAVELPRSDIWCFGFPCQDISTAGKQKGMREGTRSGLFFTVAKLIRETAEEDRPQYLFVENVKNLLSINGGWDFFQVLSEMDDLGYDAEWQVLNSKNFGVPQNRERVFVIGHLRTGGGGEVFPIGGENEAVIKRHQGDVSGKGYCSQPDRIYKTDGIMGTLMSARTETKVNIIIEDFYKGRETRAYSNESPTLRADRQGLKVAIGNEVKCLNSKDENGRQPSQHARVYDTNGLMTALQAEQGGRFNIAVEPRACLTPDRAEKRQNGRRFKTNGEPMFTLTSQDRHGVAISGENKTDWQKNRQDNRVYSIKGNSPTLNICRTNHSPKVNTGWRIRRLTPLECWRLQGFPDWAFDRAKEAGVSESQLYKQAGNSVTVNVIKAIGEKL